MISGDEEVEEKPERPRNRVIVMPEAVNNLLVGLPCAIGKRIEHEDSYLNLIMYCRSRNPIAPPVNLNNTFIVMILVSERRCPSMDWDRTIHTSRSDIVPLLGI